MLFCSLLPTIAQAEDSHSLAQLDIFKPQPKIYFRYVEGSLRNAPSDGWINRWKHLDGIVTKAYGDEAPFDWTGARDTLKKYKEAYPNKALILHLNGRARLPSFNTENIKPQDFLYFLGSKNASAIQSGEATSRIKVVDINRFVGRQNLPNNASDDVVLVEINTDGSLNWEKSEHAKILNVDKRYNELTLQRDILNQGQVSTNNNRVYIAMHVAKGPFGTNTQRLWEYNWFLAGLMPDSPRNLATRLAEEFSNLINSDSPFFDGIAFDVLTEHHTAGIPGYRQQLDINADGKEDRGLDFNLSHQQGIYRFLESIRSKLGKNKLLIADGHYGNQRAAGILNGIESESWPTREDPSLKQWSSGLNRHRFWQQFGNQPTFSYMKLTDYVDENRKAVRPDRQTRRLTVAAALLTDSAVSPAYKVNSKPFHRWPEFKAFESLGAPEGKAFVVVPDKPETHTSPTARVWKEKSWDTVYPSLNSSEAISNKALCTTIGKVDGEITLLLNSVAEVVPALPEYRPTLLIAKINDSEPKYSFTGSESFESWFHWRAVKGAEICIGNDSDTDIKIEKLTVIEGPMVVARVFQNGVLFTNISSEQASFPISFFERRYPEVAKRLSDIGVDSVNLPPRSVVNL